MSVQIGKDVGVDRKLFVMVNRFSDRTIRLHTPMRLFALYGIVAFGVLLLAAWWLARNSAEPILNVAAAIWAGARPP